MYDLPNYVWALVFTGVIGIPATTCVMLYRSALVAGLRRRTAITVAATAAAGLAGWLVVTATLARAGAYSQGSGEAVLRVGLAFTGFLGALLLSARIPPVARILAAPDTPMRLVVPHTFRVVGVLFLIVMAMGHLPAAFSLPAGLGDIAIGLSAPFVARRLDRGTDRGGAIRFNVLGLVDLAVAVSLGVLCGLASITPSTAPLRLLPLALVPTVAVPLAIALHIVSLQRLRSATRRAEGRIERPLHAAG